MPGIEDLSSAMENARIWALISSLISLPNSTVSAVAPLSNPAQDYEALAKEVLGNG